MEIKKNINFKSKSARKKYEQVKKLNQKISKMLKINERKLSDCFNI